MEFLGPLQPSRLDQINDKAVKLCSSVDAAVAYIDDYSTLIRKCFEQKKPIHIRGRYDYGSPVAISILERFLRCTSHDFRLTLVPDIFHPKVIWWHDYGVYIGSANLTSRGWFSNIEAGVFLDEGEVIAQHMREDLEKFFDYVDGVAHELSDGIVEQLRRNTTSPEAYRRQEEAKRRFEESRLIPPLHGLDSVQKIPTSAKREAAFLTEWNSCLRILTNIGEKLRNFRPSWVPVETPIGVHADQFLHGYYYQQVRGDSANEHPFDDFHEGNKSRIDGALDEAMSWWASLETAPGLEDRMITEWAVDLREMLESDRLRDLDVAEFTELCRRVHAFRDHASRISYTALDRTEKLPEMDIEKRIDLVANWLFNQRSGSRKSPIEVLHWVLYGGPMEEVPKRIFAADYDPRWKIPHVGLSMLGEIVGWAIPDRFPPRNGRTSKALRALGYPVKVY